MNQSEYALLDSYGNAFGWYATRDQALRDVRQLLDAEDRESAGELHLVHFDHQRKMHPAMAGDTLIRAAEALPASSIS